MEDNNSNLVLDIIFKKLTMFIISNFGTIILFLLLIVLPIVIIVSMPLILFSGFNDNNLNTFNEATRNMYIEEPKELQNRNKTWIDEQLDNYSWCDSFRIKDESNSEWQYFMSIDAVRTKQKFENIKQKDIQKLSEMFVKRDVEIETYEVPVVKKRADGSTYTDWETRYRAVITIKSVPFETVIHSLNLTDDEIDIVYSIFANISNFDEQGSYVSSAKIDLSNLQEYDAGSANLPYYSQKDKRWANSSYGDGTIWEAGCGPTSLAMVISGLTNNTVNPKTVSNWAAANGYKQEDGGSYWSLIPNAANHWGLSATAVSRNNPNKVIEALSNGYPVIVCMGRGHFTTTGHFIVLRGLTKDNKILVYDSWNIKNNDKEWSISTIFSESSTNGGTNGSPFWIIK